MKLFKTYSLLAAGIALGVMSCENGDARFPDYEGGVSVYFANQYPVRTIVLGEDRGANKDNEHKCIIYGTMGGSYSGKNITVDIKVDNTLTDNLYFEDGSPVQPMPAAYYTLASDKLHYNNELMGGVEVQLSDAFFADPAALSNTYVIPLVMTKQQGASRILSGTPLVEGNEPVRTDGEKWKEKPRDYTLYCVKYINPWHASYLRRGVDVIDGSNKVVRHKEEVEKDEVVELSTTTLKQVKFLVAVGADACDLLLTFNDNNECTIASATTGVTATGSGKYVSQGEKNSWGNQDRSALYLDYNIQFAGSTVATKDTLVLRSRGSFKKELFVPVYRP